MPSAFSDCAFDKWHETVPVPLISTSAFREWSWTYLNVSNRGAIVKQLVGNPAGINPGIKLLNYFQHLVKWLNLKEEFPKITQMLFIIPAMNLFTYHMWKIRPVEFAPLTAY